MADPEGPLSERFHKLVDLVAAPDADRSLVGELQDLFGEIWCVARQQGVQDHGRVIMAAISGELVSWPGCEPQWDHPLGR